MDSEGTSRRLGTVSLERNVLLGARILGLYQMADTEIRLGPHSHDDFSQQVYTLCHEGRHREVFHATTFGYLQTFLASVDARARRHQMVPAQLESAGDVLSEMMGVSFDAHEGYATMSEYVARESLVALFGRAPIVPSPTPAYERAMAPYGAIVEALPKLLRPYAHFVLRAFVEVVFDTSILQVARSSGLDLKAIRSSLQDPLMQPNGRVLELSLALVEALDRRELHPAWEGLATTARSAGDDLANWIARLRFTMPALEWVIVRRGVRTETRAAVRETLGPICGRLTFDDGRKRTHDFHNWVFQELDAYGLVDGPMLDSAVEPELTARSIAEDYHVSGQPSERIVISSGVGVPNEFIEEALADPKQRLAVGLYVLAGDATADASVRLRLLRFAARTDTWNGPGTEPYQRIIIGRCLDHEMLTNEASSVIDRLRDRTDILFYGTPGMIDSQAILLDRIVGFTRATSVHPVENFAVGTTDREKVKAMLASQKSGKRLYCPFIVDGWIGIFSEIVPRTFMGAVVLESAFKRALGSNLEQWFDALETAYLLLPAREEIDIDLGSLSTFCKLFIMGGFRSVV